MRLDEKRNVAGAEDGSDEDVESTRAGPELKQLSARLSKVEKSVRSQATATMREMHDHETQLRGFRTQLSGLADAGGIRLVGIDEDGRAPSIVRTYLVIHWCLSFCSDQCVASPTVNHFHCG